MSRATSSWDSGQAHWARKYWYLHLGRRHEESGDVCDGWLLLVVGVMDDGCWWLLLDSDGSWWMLMVLDGCWWLLMVWYYCHCSWYFAPAVATVLALVVMMVGSLAVRDIHHVRPCIGHGLLRIHCQTMANQMSVNHSVIMMPYQLYQLRFFFVKRFPKRLTS